MKKYFILLTAFLMNAMLFISSCKKETKVNDLVAKSPSSNSKAQGKKVYVSNPEELYAAVNDPENSGSDIIIAPGTYVLSASHLNGGRLELQTDMSLQGQPGHSEE